MPAQPNVPYSPFPSVAPTTSSGNDYISARATPAAFGADVGQGLERAGAQGEQVGQKVTELAMQFKQMQIATDQLEATTAASKDLGVLESKFRQLSGNNATAALPQYQNAVQDVQKKYAGNFTGTAQLGFMRDFRSLADRTELGMGIHAGTEAKRAHLGALEGSISAEQANLARDLSTTGTLPNFSTLTDRAITLSSEMGYSKEEADAFVQKTVGDAVQQMVQISVGSSDPNSFNRSDRAQHIFQQALKMNAPGTDLPLLGPQHIGAIEQQLQNVRYTDTLRQQASEARIDRERDKAAATTRVNITHGVADDLARMKDGLAPSYVAGLTPEKIKEADPNNTGWADDQLSTVSAIQEAGGLIARFPSMSPQDITTAVQSAKPDPDSQNYAKDAKVYSVLQTAANGALETMASDPAQWVLASPSSHPEVTTAWQAVQTQKDPAQYSQAFGQYAQQMLGTQEALGIPVNMRSVLPENVAKNMAGSVMANPENAPTVLKGMQQQYGSAWPQVWKDMVSKGELPTAYQAVASLDNERDGALLAQWIGGGKDTKRNVADLVGGDIVYKDINSTVDSDPSLRDLGRSLYSSGASQQMVGDIIASVKDLAYAKAARGETTPALAAIQSFTNQYDFSLPGGARIPAKNADTIITNANDFLDNLSIDKMTLPEVYGKEGMPSKDDYINVIKAAPTWITNQTGDGLLLVDPYGRIVRGPNGQTLTMPFSGYIRQSKPPEQEDGRLAIGLP